MTEFLVVFALTLLLVGGFVALQGVLRVPRYRLEREDFRQLLQDALRGEARQDRWDMIIGMPVRHDERLEAWRLRLVQLADAGRPGTEPRDGVRYCRFRQEENDLLQRILLEMDHDEHGTTERRF